MKVPDTLPPLGPIGSPVTVPPQVPPTRLMVIWDSGIDVGLSESVELTEIGALVFPPVIVKELGDGFGLVGAEFASIMLTVIVTFDEQSDGVAPSHARIIMVHDVWVSSAKAVYVKFPDINPFPGPKGKPATGPAQVPPLREMVT